MAQHVTTKINSCIITKAAQSRSTRVEEKEKETLAQGPHLSESPANL
jgi:hypothetical protein